MTTPKTILWTDLETTGLSNTADSILEIFTISAAFTSPFQTPENASTSFEKIFSFRSWNEVEENVIKMHYNNGLLAKCVLTEPTRADDPMEDYRLVDRELVHLYMPGSQSWAEENCLIPVVKEEDKLVLAGSSVHFDLSFIRSHFPGFAACLSHKVYDVSAIKLFCYSLGMPEIPKGEEKHRARADVMHSIATARKCIEWLKGHHW